MILFVVEVFVEEFLKELSGNECILFLKGNLVREVILVVFWEIGVFLDELIVYGMKVNIEKK